MFLKRSQTIVVLVVFGMCLACSLSVGAQQSFTSFDKIEQAIARTLPEWILLDRWPNANPRYKTISYRWQVGKSEVVVWMVEEQNAEDAARTFYEVYEFVPHLANRPPPTQLLIGDKCYILESLKGRMDLLLKRRTSSCESAAAMLSPAK